MAAPIVQPQELIQPTAISNQPITETVTDRLNTFIDQVNQLALDVNNDVMSQSVVLLQQHIDEYTTEVEIASKTANSVVKSINTLSTLQ